MTPITAGLHMNSAVLEISSQMEKPRMVAEIPAFTFVRVALCLRHMCRNVLVSSKCVEACCVVISWDGVDHHIELQKGRLMWVQKLTRADVCVTFVETLWFRRNVRKPAVRLFLGMGPITVSNCRKCNACRCFFVFGLSHSRTEHRLVHL